jgi:L-2-hydroxyglutarate oxidase LhgO
MCNYANADYKPWCFFGVVKNLIDLDARAGSGLSFCRDIKDVNSKYVCYSAVGEQILILAPEEPRRRSLCASAEAEYLDACLYGARVTGVTAPKALLDYWNKTGKS